MGTEQITPKGEVTVRDARIATEAMTACRQRPGQWLGAADIFQSYADRETFRILHKNGLLAFVGMQCGMGSTDVPIRQVRIAGPGEGAMDLDAIAKLSPKGLGGG
jgi:hypothetical protein